MRFVRPIEVTDAILASSNIPDAEYGQWDSATAYVAGDRVTILGTDTHDVYEALQAGTNKDPTDAANAAYWAFVYVTNRWRMFDRSVSTQSSASGQIQVVLAPADVVDTVGLLNLDATEVQVQMVDGVDGTVYDQTVSLEQVAGLDDFWEWCFDPPTFVHEYAFTGLPIYPSAQLTVTISNPGGIAACGALVIGQGKEIGGTEYGAQVGITNYSKVAPDDWGNYQIVERAFAARGEFSVVLQPYMVDYLRALIAEFRAKPALYIGSELYGSTMIYGIYKDANIVIQRPSYSVWSLRVDGLT